MIEEVVEYKFIGNLYVTTPIHSKSFNKTFYFENVSTGTFLYFEKEGIWKKTTIKSKQGFEESYKRLGFECVESSPLEFLLTTGITLRQSFEESVGYEL